MLEFEWKNE